MTDRNKSKEQKLAAELAALDELSIGDLRIAWRRLYRSHPPKSLRRDLVQMAVACKMQEKALGGHSAATRRQLKDLAQTREDKTNLAEVRRVRLRPGARLIREWGGGTHEVLVTEDGFVWCEKNWNSLSVIAREITGARWSGPRFFGIDKSTAKSPGDVEGKADA